MFKNCMINNLRELYIVTSSGLLDLLLTTGSVVSDVQGTRGGRAHWNSEHSLWAEAKKTDTAGVCRVVISPPNSGEAGPMALVRDSMPCDLHWDILDLRHRFISLNRQWVVQR